MKVLVTGAAGFIGSAICRQLAAGGHQVVAVDLMIPQAHGCAVPPVGVHGLDVRDAESWTDLLEGVDAVCHQAALVGAGVRVSDLPVYAAHNDLGTAALLSAMHVAGVAGLVLASSMVVYGEGRYSCAEHGPQLPGPRAVASLEAGRFDHRCAACATPLEWDLVDEDAALEPRSGYAASKVAQEHYASAWARQSGGSVVALRYHNVYGPQMPRDTPYSGVAAMFRSSLERGEAPRVFEDGRQMRDFVHVDDVARANVLALGAVTRTAGFRAYNVCSGRPVAIGEVAALVAEGASSPRVPVVTGGFRAGDVRHVVASPARAADELGFVASVVPEDGLRAFATEPLRESPAG
ncbi:MAG TPA: NAD-dependent epimerase/dehydratase family protein [Marmoricola sp.]|nr:NAD-dependent epimerase/dehydratase family protein [Marmoricola sp.]